MSTPSSRSSSQSPPSSNTAPSINSNSAASPNASSPNASSPESLPATGEAPTALSDEERKARRENARRVLRESGVAEILQTLNSQALQGRGWFEEYDSGVIFKWGGLHPPPHLGGCGG